jgi:Golgi phosphoprotein 3
MATHLPTNLHVNDAVVSHVIALLTIGTSAVPPAALQAPGTQMRALWTVCLACPAYATSVLDNAFSKVRNGERDARCDDILASFAVWPFGTTPSPSYALHGLGHYIIPLPGSSLVVHHV